VEVSSLKMSPVRRRTCRTCSDELLDCTLRWMAGPRKVEGRYSSSYIIAQNPDGSQVLNSTLSPKIVPKLSTVSK
jgi:hypothetical protein